MYNDYIICPYCFNNITIELSEIYSLLKYLKGTNKMDFDKLLEVVKASQIATLETQKIMLQQLENNTNTKYTTSIAKIDSQITKIENL